MDSFSGWIHSPEEEEVETTRMLAVGSMNRNDRVASNQRINEPPTRHHVSIMRKVVKFFYYKVLLLLRFPSTTTTKKPRSPFKVRFTWLSEDILRERARGDARTQVVHVTYTIDAKI